MTLCLPAFPAMLDTARVRALEEKLPGAERPIKRYLPPGGELPSKAVGQVRSGLGAVCFCWAPLWLWRMAAHGDRRLGLCSLPTCANPLVRPSGHSVAPRRGVGAGNGHAAAGAGGAALVCAAATATAACLLMTALCAAASLQAKPRCIALACCLQDTALDQQRHRENSEAAGGGCCSCCTIM